MTKKTYKRGPNKNRIPYEWRKKLAMPPPRASKVNKSLRIPNNERFDMIMEVGLALANRHGPFGFTATDVLEALPGGLERGRLRYFVGNTSSYRRLICKMPGASPRCKLVLKGLVSRGVWEP